MQNPNSKSKVFNNLSLKKCRSIIRNLLTGLLPTVNSTLQKKTVTNIRSTTFKKKYNNNNQHQQLQDVYQNL